MSGPVWFDANKDECEQIEKLHNQRIAVKAVLPNGWIIEGIAELWTRINGSRQKAAVTVVFEYSTEPYVITQTQIHLGKEQLRNISKSSRPDADCEYDGDLMPIRIPLNSKP